MHGLGLAGASADLIIGTAIVAALVGILALARRKAWNADGSDDERRRQVQQFDGAVDEDTLAALDPPDDVRP